MASKLRHIAISVRDPEAAAKEWYRKHGRHAVYAKNQDLPLPETLGTVVLPDSALEMEKRDQARKRVRLPIAAE